MLTIDPKTATPSIEVHLSATDGTDKTDLNAAALTVQYRRGEAGALTTVTLSGLASVSTAWTAGGVIHIAGGSYRVDLPLAARPADGMVTRVYVSATDTIQTAGPAELLGEAIASHNTPLPKPIAPAWTLDHVGHKVLVPFVEFTPTPSNPTYQNTAWATFVPAAEMPGDLPANCLGVIYTSTYHIDLAEGGGVFAHFVLGDQWHDADGEIGITIKTLAQLVSDGDAPGSWGVAGTDYPTTTSLIADQPLQSDQPETPTFFRRGVATYMTCHMDNVDGVATRQRSFAWRVTSAVGFTLELDGSGDPLVVFGRGSDGTEIANTGRYGDRHTGYQRKHHLVIEGQQGTQFATEQTSSASGASSEYSVVTYADPLAPKRIKHGRDGQGATAIGLPAGTVVPAVPRGPGVQLGRYFVCVESFSEPASGGAAAEGRAYSSLWEVDGFSRVSRPKVIERGAILGDADALRFLPVQLIKADSERWVCLGVASNASNQRSIAVVTLRLAPGSEYEPVDPYAEFERIEGDFVNDPPPKAEFTNTTTSGAWEFDEHGFQTAQSAGGEGAIAWRDRPFTIDDCDAVSVRFHGIAAVTDAPITIGNLGDSLTRAGLRRSDGTSITDMLFNANPHAGDILALDFGANNNLQIRVCTAGENRVTLAPTYGDQVYGYSGGQNESTFDGLPTSIELLWDIRRSRVTAFVNDVPAFDWVDIDPTFAIGGEWEAAYAIDGATSNRTLALGGITIRKMRGAFGPGRQLVDASSIDDRSTLAAANTAVEQATAAATDAAIAKQVAYEASVEFSDLSGALIVRAQATRNGQTVVITAASITISANADYSSAISVGDSESGLLAVQYSEAGEGGRAATDQFVRLAITDATETFVVHKVWDASEGRSRDRFESVASGGLTTEQAAQLTAAAAGGGGTAPTITQRVHKKNHVPFESRTDGWFKSVRPVSVAVGETPLVAGDFSDWGDMDWSSVAIPTTSSSAVASPGTVAGTSYGISTKTGTPCFVLTPNASATAGSTCVVTMTGVADGQSVRMDFDVVVEAAAAS